MSATSKPPISRQKGEPAWDIAELFPPQGYWIVDPQTETISVLTLRDQQYAEHGVFARSMTATSPMFSDLHIDVSALFDAE